MPKLVQTARETGRCACHARPCRPEYSSICLPAILVCLSAHLIFDVGAEVHAGAAPPDKPGHILPASSWRLNEIDGCGSGLVVHGFHALLCQRAGVFNSCRLRRIVMTPRGPNRSRNSGVRWIIVVLRLFLGIEVISDFRKTRQNRGWWAAFHRGHPGGSCQTDLWRSPESFNSHGDGWIFDLHTFLGTGQAHFGLRPVRKHGLPHDERRSAGGAGSARRSSL